MSIDFNGDGYKDIAIEVARNYETEPAFMLWLSDLNGGMNKVAGFEKLFAPKFDLESGKLSTFMTTGPAKGGYIYEEYRWDDLDLKLERKTVQEVVVNEAGQTQFQISEYEANAEDSVELIQQELFDDYQSLTR